jgi:amidase
LKRTLFSVLLAVTVVALAVPAAALGAPTQSYVIEETTVEDIHQAFADRELSCEQLTRAYLARIAAYDDAGPELNTLITVAPDALDQARALDRAYRSGGPTGELHCIPVVLKDNIDTTDMPTTGGSQTLTDDLPIEEAFIVTKLRESGAIILAKGNMDEWAHGGAGGYSSVGGRTFNPYNLGSPSGSSGGPAAAVAANFAVLSVGTDTLGSIRGPVQTNRLAGVKPTSGLVSGTGVIPFSLTFDAAGPMTRTVTDSARMLNVLAGVDPDDPRTRAAEGLIPDDYTDLLTEDALEGVRIGIIDTYFNESNPALAQVLEDLEAAGAELVTGIEAPSSITPLSGQFYQLISETEFVAQLEDYLTERRPNAEVRTHADVFAAAQQPDSLMAPVILDRLTRESTRGTLEDPAYLDAVEFAPTTMRAGIDQMIDDNDVDALVHTGASALANFSGYPSVIAHAGVQPSGSPIAIQFLGKAFSEAELLAYAYAYEQISDLRVAPDEFTPPIALSSRAECNQGGWATSTAPLYPNQGLCVASFASSGRPGR